MNSVLILLLILILLNGLFAMSEMALVSSAKARLQKQVDEGRRGARAAMQLHEQPARFLSTVQVGITSVAILSGALGEDAITDPLQKQLMQIPWLTPYADNIALVLTVVLITYFSVVIGELVPKRLALLQPEGIALIVARPMNLLATLVSPLVWLLSASSNALLFLFGAHRTPQATVTNEEIKILMEIGSEAGVFHASEKYLVTNVLKLDEQRIGAIMTPRKDIYLIDLASDTDMAQAIASCIYSRVVVCRDGLENIQGVLHRGDLLKTLIGGGSLDIDGALRPPLYVPNTLTLPHLLEFFRERHGDFALVVNEYGDLEGLVTLSDVLTAIVGDIPDADEGYDPDIVQRDDGSWLVDGGLSVGRLKSAIGITSQLPGERDNAFNTVGGFVLYYLERIPRVTEHFEHGDWYFEVVDIDGTRVDKVLVARKTTEAK
ncbi:MAG: HlyC/CorC family transporter [Methylomonas sp.]|nr:HlyC/CorC family transporter [Methylomonas sp.]PPD21127.1 MAG: hypothetical protein CTY23_06460 [Methylomonas sp.]PPD27561.1 MAG: hypothetical protein CTY22_01490 [Methylomonas sp.]PPD39557.1 MAG: hypothetical protein CTY21_01485 [Methylomonas sp.]PPD55808.1 MAG: hypothetical protein CTY11_00755 [Methylomonas sp.]